MADGARYALGGYLYQFLGAAGLSALARNVSSNLDTDVQKHDLASRRISVVHEQDDMDVVVMCDGINSTVGVQLKYSGKSPPRSIEGKELIEILDAFHRSSNQRADLRFTGFALISNRVLASSAETLYETRSQDKPDIRLRPRSVQGKYSKTDTKVLKQYGDADRAAVGRHAILSKLATYTGVSQTVWIDGVRSYASRHGVLPREFEAALDRLVGTILQRTIGNPLELTTEFLNECLLRAADARSLDVKGDAECARAAAADALSDFVSAELVDDENTLIRRRLIEEVEREVSMHSLVFVVGNGGSGKSVLAAQYLQNEAANRFVGAAFANDVKDDWPSRLLRSWRSPGHPLNFGIESTNDMIGRLRHANQGASVPILVLDLDAIDEVASEARLSVQSLIRQFWNANRSNAPDAVLLVTCRTIGTVPEQAIDALVRKWIRTDIFHSRTDSVGKVFVGDFDAEELNAAALRLGTDYWSRLAPSLASIQVREIEPPSFSGETFQPSAYRSVAPAMVESLRHPAMWGSFVNLPPHMRHRILDQERLALNELAERFLVRFCEKTCRRRTSLLTDYVRKALRAICVAMPDKPSILTRLEHWIEPARGPLSNEEAEHLYNEAISYGLTVEDARNVWAWRHGFVCDYLKES
jgi:hypothetical protein